jgi:hypothetical protein
MEREERAPVAAGSNSMAAGDGGELPPVIGRVSIATRCQFTAASDLRR